MKVNNVVLSNTVLGLNYIFVLFGPAYKKYVHKKATQKLHQNTFMGIAVVQKSFEMSLFSRATSPNL